MNEADFSSVANMAEMSRLQFELDYTEGISQQMRIPDRLKIGPGSSQEHHAPFLEEPQSTMMQVPDRIVVAGDGNDTRFSIPRELDLIQSTSVEYVELKAPPQVLTLKDQPLHFLEPEHQAGPIQLKEEVRSHRRLRRERCASENLGGRQFNGQYIKYDANSPSSGAPMRTCPPLVSPEDWPNMTSAGGILSYFQLTTRRAYQQVLTMLNDSHHRTALVNLETNLESTPEDSALADASALRRQIMKLNRRLQLLEHENKERARRDMVMYSLTAALWLLNAWMLVRR